MISGQRIVCLSSLAWHGRPTSRHHLARIFAEENDLLFVDPPRNLIRTRSVHRGRLHHEDGIVRLEPPPHLPVGGDLRFAAFTRLNQRRYAAAVERAVRSLGWRNPLLWSVFPVYSGARVAEHLRPSRHILHMTDSLWDLPQYRAEYEGFLRRILATVDVAVGTTPAITERLGTYGVPTQHLGHGVDVELFETALSPDPPLPDALRAQPRPRLGVVGQLDHRLDVELVVALTEEGSVTLVGPSVLPAEETAALQRAGCLLAGEVPYDDVPHWLAGFDVALLPYRLIDVVVASRPLKLLDYLAAGLPVVSIDIPAARDLTPVVTTAGSREAFVAAVRECAAETDPATRQAGRELARRHSWRQVAEQLSSLFEHGHQP